MPPAPKRTARKKPSFLHTFAMHEKGPRTMRDPSAFENRMPAYERPSQKAIFGA